MPKPSAPELFADADRKYGALKDRLYSSGMSSLPHSVVEKLVVREGREVVRTLLQSHLELRGLAEPVTSPLGSDGIGRTHRRRDTSRSLTTLLGPVDVSRSRYEQRDVPGVHPVDAELNLPADKYSLPVRQRVASVAAQSSFDATVETLSTTTGAKVPKRQVEELVRRAAIDFDAYYAETEPNVDPATTADILVLTFDGKGVVLRQEDLREATRKAAEEATPRQSTRLAKGEKRNRKRMATVAAVYTVKPHVRTADEIIAGLRSVRAVQSLANRAKRPRPEYKRVWASLQRSTQTVIDDAFAEASSRDPERRKTWVVVVDGAEHQLTLVKQAARRHGVDVVIVLDFIHVLEYLWKATHVFNKEGSPAAEKWVLERLARVLAGEATQVAAGIRRSATKRGIKARKRKRADKCADYLTKYAAHLRYDAYMTAGLPIASGVIEGACRHLIGDRLDITGARWSLDGAEAVLRLRALRSSGDFEEYWAFHEEQEWTRNHRAKYAGGTLPELVHPGSSRHLRPIR